MLSLLCSLPLLLVGSDNTLLDWAFGFETGLIFVASLDVTVADDEDDDVDTNDGEDEDDSTDFDVDTELVVVKDSDSEWGAV